MSRYRLRFHRSTAGDLVTIADWITETAGSTIADQKIRQILATIYRLAETPHVGSLRHHISANLRAIPAARKAVVTFMVDDVRREVFILSVTWSGADWWTKARDRT